MFLATEKCDAVGTDYNAPYKWSPALSNSVLH